MIAAESFIRAAQNSGFSLYAGVPCSYLKPFINYVIDAQELRYIGAANEGDAVAIAAGASLAGQGAVAMFQNSGLGNAVNPLTSLTWTFRIPILLITTLRGEPGGPADEPQHELMGQVTTQMLETMEIPWAYFPRDEEQIEPSLAMALEHMRQTGRPYALVMRKGSVAPVTLKSSPPARWPNIATPAPRAATHTRAAMLRAVQSGASDQDIIVATTGYTGRELYACEDRDNQLYMVGSMGCAGSFGFGLAAALPKRRIVVLDGDGAALMRLGAFATLGYEQPPNMLHVLLDNGVHESTGGQATVSPSVDFTAVASACGYPRVDRVTTPEELEAVLTDRDAGLRLVHVPIERGVPDDLPRPSVTPVDVAARLRAQILAG